MEVRPDEQRPAALMLAYGFLAMAAFYVLKPVRNSVFVDRVGADNLPYVYVATALVVGTLMVGYSRYAERADRQRLLQGTFALVAASLLLFWGLLRTGSSDLTAGAFYVWGKIVPVLLVSQFWLVGSLVFDTRQARRLYGPVGVGLILGGIAGSWIASAATGRAGTENLLLVSVALLGLCSPVVRRLDAHTTADEGGDARLVEEPFGDAFALLRDSSHLRTVAWILGLTILVSTLVDWQFNKAVELFIVGEDAKTAFFGRFFLIVNVASVVVQLLLTGWILKRFGAGLAVLALPALLAAASVGVLAAPVLLTAAVAKGGEGALRHSLDQSTRELLWLPVPTDVRSRVKPLVDLGVYRGATGLAGLALLGAVKGLGLGIQEIAALALGLTAVWMWFGVRMRREFRASVKRLIGVRDIRLEDLIVRRLDAVTLEQLRRVLVDGDEEEVLFALRLLEHHVPEAFGEILVPLLDHPSADVRARAVELLRELDLDQHVGVVEPLVHDPSLRVRVEAVYYLCSHAEEDTVREIMKRMEAEDEDVRTAAIACTFRHGGEDEREAGLATLGRLVRDDDPATRLSAARLLSEIGDAAPGIAALLDELLEDGHREVRFAALEAIGRLGPDARDRELSALRRGEAPPALWSRLPELVDGAPDADLLRSLVENVAGMDDPGVRYVALKGLNKLARGRPELEFRDGPPTTIALREIRLAHRWATARDDVAGVDGEQRDALLAAALEQRAWESVERAFRALGLRYGLEELYVAFTAVRSTERLDRRRGVELLESVLPRSVFRKLQPLVDPDVDASERRRAGRETHGIQRKSGRERLEELTGGGDPWISMLCRRVLGRELGTEDRETLFRHLEIESRTGGLPPETEEVSPVDILERAEALRKTDLFDELRTDDLAALASLVEERHLEAGETVVRDGEMSGRLRVVVKGRLEARMGERTVHTIQPGEAVDDFSILDGGAAHHDVVAAEPATLLVLRRAEFLEILEERPQVAERLLAHLARRVRELEKEGHAPER
ncbi:MAG: HEAT repeat domain-containing protein [Gemmatimonadota bacterium]